MKELARSPLQRSIAGSACQSVAQLAVVAKRIVRLQGPDVIEGNNIEETPIFPQRVLVTNLKGFVEPLLKNIEVRIQLVAKSKFQRTFSWSSNVA